ncbi:hypothetical protein BD626DRAFT_550867 [Schizophyllum amplum]|uniref:Uncharacterized protein n=1 Tax=Schizophyllum amplum TaxID=97359 RepID=A0A550BZ86_9AGAR|nr:hypothetical protein BD626DRAFT_550867 [Auriculariopsis ampla]
MAQEPHLQQASNVTRATQKLDRLAAAMPPSDVTDRLLRAVEDFRSRIEPAFIRLEEQKQEIDALKSAAERRLATVKGLNESLEKERKESSKIHRRLADTTKKLDDALDCADRSRKWAEGVEAEKLETQRNCDEALRALAGKTAAHDKLAADNKRYTGLLDSQKSTIERYKREKSELKKEINGLRRERDEARSEVDTMTQLDDRSDLTFDDFSEFSAPSSSRAVAARPLPSISRGIMPSAGRVSSPSVSISLSAPPSSPPTYTPIEDDFEDCMPPPGFRSDWSTTGMRAGTLARSVSVGIKRKLAQREDAAPGPRVPQVLGNTLRLDRNGRPLGPMACGPKRSRRAPPA